MSWVHSWLLGVDPEADQKAADAADQKLRELNQTKRAQFGDEWFNETEANLERGRVVDAVGQVNQAFSDSIRKDAGELVQTSATVLVPWQLWLLLGIGVFVYSGGLKQLRK